MKTIVKKMFAMLLAACLVLALAACASNKEQSAETKPSEQAVKVTEQAPETTPEATAEPTPEPTPIPTLSPVPAELPEGTVTGGADLCMELKSGETVSCDIDGDGLVDAVIFNKIDEGKNVFHFIVTVTRGARPDSPVSVDGWSYDGGAWLVDCDPFDGRLEVLYTDDGDSGDPSGRAVRVDASGETKVYSIPGVTIDEEHPFTSEKGFRTIAETWIMGTQFITACMRIGENGPELTDGGWRFEEVYCGYEVLKELPVRLIGEDGEPEAEQTLIHEGETVKPILTDGCEPSATTYVIVELEDGRLARIDTEFDAETYAVLINGANQFEYLDLPDEG